MARTSSDRRATWLNSVQAIVDRASESAPDHLVICAREGIATYWLARRHLPNSCRYSPTSACSSRCCRRRQISPKAMATSPSSLRSRAPQTWSRGSSGGCTTFSMRRPSYLARHGEPKAMSDLQAPSMPEAGGRGVSTGTLATRRPPPGARYCPTRWKRTPARC